MAVVHPRLSESKWDKTICLAIGRKSQSLDRCYRNIVRTLGGGFGRRDREKRLGKYQIKKKGTRGYRSDVQSWVSRGSL